MKTYQAIIETPFSFLGVLTADEFVISIDFLPLASKPEPFVSSDLTQNLQQQIQCYLSHSLDQFDVPLKPEGTEFQRFVWQLLQSIKPGDTLTYGEAAEQLNSSPRAVGNACRRNPIPLIIPCHRVVAKNGLGGFAGKTQGEVFNIKRWLLAHEMHNNGAEFELEVVNSC